jgi:hypothetical protein
MPLYNALPGCEGDGAQRDNRNLIGVVVVS